jgi:hypothetical protein
VEFRVGEQRARYFIATWNRRLASSRRGPRRLLSRELKRGHEIRDRVDHEISARTEQRLAGMVDATGAFGR